MTNDATKPESTKPAGGAGSGAGKPGPTGAEGAAPKNAQDLDLTPDGLANEPAKQEDPDSLVEPENS